VRVSQVVSIKLRCAARAGDELPAVERELDYLGMLNKALPADIRVRGWCPLPDDFTARCDATPCHAALTQPPHHLLVTLHAPGARAAGVEWCGGMRREGLPVRVAFIGVARMHPTAPSSIHRNRSVFSEQRGFSGDTNGVR
jgi:hypothetical protein